MNSPLLMIEVQESISLKTADNYIKTFVQLPFVFYSFLLFWFILLRDYIFRYGNFLSKTKFAETETFFSETIFFETDAETLKNFESFETEMSHSGHKAED